MKFPNSPKWSVLIHRRTSCSHARSSVPVFAGLLVNESIPTDVEGRGIRMTHAIA